MRKPKIVFIDSGVAADNQMLKNETIEEIEIPNECAGESFQSGHGTAIYGILRRVRENFLILRILKTGISLEAMPPWVSENGFSSFQAVC